MQLWRTQNPTSILGGSQYSCLENPMDGGAWWAAVHEVAKSLTRLSDFTFTFHFHALEKEMATHSSVLAWRIPGTEDCHPWWAAICGVAQSRTRLKWLSSSSRSPQLTGWRFSCNIFSLVKTEYFLEDGGRKEVRGWTTFLFCAR